MNTSELLVKVFVCVDIGVNISKMPFYICVSFFNAKKVKENGSIKERINTNDVIDRTSPFKFFSDYQDC